MGKNKKIIASSVSAILLSLPAIVFAALPLPGVVGGNLTGLVDFIIDNVVLFILWSIAVAFVIIMFVIAGFKYLTAQGDPSKISEANKAVIWGLAGALVILVAYSIVSLVRTQLGV